MNHYDVDCLDQDFYDMLAEVFDEDEDPSLLSLTDDSHSSISNQIETQFIQNNNVYSDSDDLTISTEECSSNTVLKCQLHKSTRSFNNRIFQVPQNNFNVLTFPSLFVFSLNSGDINVLYALFMNYLDSNCLFRAPKMDNSFNLNGQQFLEFMNQKFQIVPDRIIYLKKVDVVEKQMKYTTLICSLNSVSTNNYKYYLTEIFSKQIVDSMNLKKFSEEDINRMRSEEELICQTKQLVKVFTKVTMKFYIDNETNKILGCDFQSEIKSFQLVNLNTEIDF